LKTGPAEFDRHILALDVTGFGQALAKRSYHPFHWSGRTQTEEPDHQHCLLLLRARRKRPRRYRAAAKQDDEIAPSYT
jgi:hypothetical protein